MPPFLQSNVTPPRYIRYYAARQSAIYSARKRARKDVGSKQRRHYYFCCLFFIRLFFITTEVIVSQSDYAIHIYIYISILCHIVTPYVVTHMTWRFRRYSFSFHAIYHMFTYVARERVREQEKICHITCHTLLLYDIWYCCWAREERERAYDGVFYALYCWKML